MGWQKSQALKGDEDGGLNLPSLSHPGSSVPGPGPVMGTVPGLPHGSGSHVRDQARLRGSLRS